MNPTRTMKLAAWLLASLLALAFAAAGPAQAQTKPADTRQAIEARLAQRYPQLAALQKAGKVGETYKGLIEPVKEEHGKDPKVAEPVKAENADRQQLYALIAQEKKITADAVGALAAKVNFKKAQPYEYLKVDEKRWVQKKDWKG